MKSKENGIKLNQEDLKQLEIRKDVIIGLEKEIQLLQRKQLEFQLLNLENNYFMRSLLTKLGCDVKEKYNIDFKTGILKKIEPENKLKDGEKIEDEGLTIEKATSKKDEGKTKTD